VVYDAPPVMSPRGVAAVQSGFPAADRNARPVRPFLKWAGGKRQLLPQLRRFIPPTFGDYHEPFVGSGALFFDLSAAGHLSSRGSCLIDTNADLVGCYQAVASHVGEVIEHLRRLDERHRADGAVHYYRVRDELFNAARRARAGTSSPYPPNLAAMLIYLNRTGFNGLYRLNASGEFNVPAGRYANPLICDPPNLRAVASALRRPGVQVVHGTYSSVRTLARPGDLLYFDPPYAPLSSTASFTSYTASGFSDVDQRSLQELVIELAARGCHVLVSNSTAPLITALYARNDAASRAGLRAHKVPAKRAINSNATLRGDVMEYIITNITPRD
jgi:DNA adenine methylase